MPVMMAQAGALVGDQADMELRVLANVMDQVADLGRHATDIMAGIGGPRSPHVQGWSARR